MNALLGNWPVTSQVLNVMPEPRPLVAIERQSGSVSDICLSGEASNALSIAASRYTASSSFASFSLSRVLISSTVSDGST